MLRITVLASILLMGTAFSATAKEYPVGKPQTLEDLDVAAVYLQPIEMEPAGMMRPATDSDIHLEADIKATKDNKNGFAKGDWVPDLAVEYTLTKDGTEVAKGPFMPMVANDGPHYGDNVRMAGNGRYQLILKISPPSANQHVHFGRHVDKETGVAPWFKPFEAKYDFVYAGTGKKGGY